MVYKKILHEGLRTYRFKNSKIKPIDYFEEMKGSVFVYSSKENMIATRGIVMTSIEAIKDNQKYISHWTPNVYCYGTYVGSHKQITKGHRENNLKQINTFFVDFDSKDITESDILLACYDWGFMPTIIIKTEKGYQVYFVLESPVYMTKHTDFKVIEVAKIISKNIRYYLMKQRLPVDMLCNHFGIARFPTKDNMVYCDLDNVYSFSKWMYWSLKQEDNISSKVNFSVITGTSGIKQSEEKWFELLLNQYHIKGKKSMLGRNNVLFTLALACFSSGLSQVDCANTLDGFNDRLEEPLNIKEFNRIISSAYSGKYDGASREYILELCRLWISTDLRYHDLFTFQKWKKYKKARENRIRSHYSEWEVDVLDYLYAKEETFIKLTKKEFVEAIRIPKRTLDIVLNRLIKKRLILFSSHKGRYGYIKIALLKKVCLQVITMARERKELFISQLATFLNGTVEVFNQVIDKYIVSELYPLQTTLFDVDVGYMAT